MKPILRIISLLLCAAVIFSPSTPSASASPSPNPLLRIGLSVGSSAMVAAHLENNVGSGYEFGYIDANSEFIALGRTEQSKLSMVKNRNVYLSGGVYSDTEGGSVVGAFHDNLGTYPTREDAENAVALYRSQGIAAFVSFTSGAWLVRANSYADSNGGTRVTGSKYAVSVVVTGTADIIFQFDFSETFHLCVRPLAGEGVNPVTWHNKYRYYGMFEFRRFDGNNIYVYNVVDMQDYIKCVIPYEMSPTFPLEALKAQAVSARSYAVANLARHKSSGGFDLCNNEHCQVYFGTTQAKDTTNQAVDETYGQYLTHSGTVCNTVYHASSGGATEDSENVWYDAVPYLRGVTDSYENFVTIPGYQWQYTVTNAQISSWLKQIGYSNSGVSNFYIDTYTSMGNAYSITFLDTSGNKIVSFTKESARTRLVSLVNTKNSLSLRYSVLSGDTVLSALSSGGAITTHTDLSNLYAIDGDGNIVTLSGDITLLSSDGLHGLPTTQSSSGIYTIIGRGNGHNVGMSQWGANGMAQQGYTYDQILTHYFTGTEISSG